MLKISDFAQSVVEPNQAVSLTATMVDGRPSVMGHDIPNKVRPLRHFAIHVLGIKAPHKLRKQELLKVCKTKLSLMKAQ